MKETKIPNSTEWCHYCDKEIKVNKVVNICKCGHILIGCNQCLAEKCFRCKNGNHFEQR